MDEKIEEMAKDIVRMAGLDVYGKAEYLIKQGYRKESDTAREILMEIKQLCIKKGTLYLHDWVSLCKKYGVDREGENDT